MYSFNTSICLWGMDLQFGTGEQNPIFSDEMDPELLEGTILLMKRFAFGQHPYSRSYCEHCYNIRPMTESWTPQPNVGHDLYMGIISRRLSDDCPTSMKPLISISVIIFFSFLVDINYINGSNLKRSRLLPKSVIDNSLYQRPSCAPLWLIKVMLPLNGGEAPELERKSICKVSLLSRSVPFTVTIAIASEC